MKDKYFRDFEDPITAIHHIHNGKKLHIYWNYFLPGYKHYGVSLPNKYHPGIAFFFGKGEFVISWIGIRNKKELL